MDHVFKIRKYNVLADESGFNSYAVYTGGAGTRVASHPPVNEATPEIKDKISVQNCKWMLGIG
jgi:hypothetical protein